MRARVFGPAVLTALLAAPAPGQVPSTATNKWSSLGPFARGGGIRALAAAIGLGASRLHVSTDTGVFRSLDSGATWLPANDGLPLLGARSLPLVASFVVDPLNPSVVYAAGGEGVFKSTDDGASWRSVSEGLNGQEIAALAVDPRAPSTIYAGSTNYPGGVFKSTNGGEIWFQLNTASTDAFSIAIDPTAPNRVYLAGTGGVFLSTDGGSSWSLSLASATAFGFRFVRVDPAAPAVVYAGGANVFKSTDAGRTWSPADHGLPFNAISSFEIDPIAHNTLLAGLDGGPGSTVGLWRSTDAGSNWARVDAVLAPGGVSAFAVDPARVTHVLAGLRLWDPTHGPVGGILESEDFGATWTDRSVSLRGRYVQTLAVSPGPEEIVYTVLSDDYLASASVTDVWRSDDGGRTWTKPASSGLKAAEIGTLVIHPRNPLIVLAATANGVFRSGDRAETWVRLSAAPSGPITAILFDPARPDRLLAAANGAAFESIDAGASWVPLGTGPVGRIAVVAIDPRTSTVYAGGDGLFRLSGLTWVAIRSAPFEGITSIAFAPGALLAATIYTGPLPGSLPPFEGILRSTDSGATWEATPTSGVIALAVDPVAPSQVYAGTTFGILRSRNGGATWTPANDGLMATFVRSIAVSGDSGVFAGSFGAGVFGGRFVVGPRRPVPREVPFRGPPGSSPSRATPER